MCERFHDTRPPPTAATHGTTARGWSPPLQQGVGSGSYTSQYSSDTHSSVDELNRKEVSVCHETSIFGFSSENGFRKCIKTYFDHNFFFLYSNDTRHIYYAYIYYFIIIYNTRVPVRNCELYSKSVSKCQQQAGPTCMLQAHGMTASCTSCDGSRV